MTLYARIATLLLGFVAVSALTLSLFFYQVQVEEFERQRAESAESLTAAIAKSVFADTLEERRLKVHTTLRRIAMVDENISYILVIGFDGQVFTSTFPGEPPPALVDFHDRRDAGQEDRQLILAGNEISDFVLPLVENLDAHIHVGYNARRFERTLQETRGRAIWLTLAVIGLALLVANLAAGRITLPLKLLAAAASRYGKGQPFTAEGISQASPEIRMLVASFTAMAEQREKTELDLRIAAIAFETQEAIIITDIHSKIVRVNRAFTRITGYPEEAVIGQSPAMFKSGRHDGEFYRQM